MEQILIHNAAHEHHNLTAIFETSDRSASFKSQFGNLLSCLITSCGFCIRSIRSCLQTTTSSEPALRVELWITISQIRSIAIRSSPAQSHCIVSRCPHNGFSSHVDIGKSDEVDELAKKAAEEGADVEVDHLPVLSSYKLHFRKTSKENLLQYLFENVRPSSNDLNFSRKAFCPQWDSESRTEIDRYAEETDTHPLVNRARTGHSLARAHLYHIKMEDDNTCRHCEDDIETIQHQILSCPKLATNNTLQTALRQYAPADLTEDSFEDWIWTAELRQITRLLLAARHAGCHI